MKPVDAHCHLDFDRFDEDRTEVLERCRKELDFIVVAGCDPDRNEAVKELCSSRDFLVPCYGLHPTFTDSFDRVDEVKQQVKNGNPVAVGEIGLDHHHVTDERTQQRQKEIFIEMLELAEELDKPVVVHSRSAEERCVELVKEHDVRALFHCFNGDPELAERIIENDNLVGITTQVLYSSNIQELAEKLPLESILLETDAPFLYPDGRNEPVNVKESAEKIAELRGMSAQKVVDTTTENASHFFDR